MFDYAGRGRVLKSASSGKSKLGLLVVLSPHQGGSAALTCCREHLRVSCQEQSPSLYFLLGIIMVLKLTSFICGI